MDQIELDHVSQVIGYHPSYLEQFLKIQTFIMQGDGPLPYDYRHYLAIMVSQINSLVIYRPEKQISTIAENSLLSLVDINLNRLRRVTSAHI